MNPGTDSVSPLDYSVPERQREDYWLFEQDSLLVTAWGQILPKEAYKVDLKANKIIFQKKEHTSVAKILRISPKELEIELANNPNMPSASVIMKFSSLSSYIRPKRKKVETP
jgi:hypothetical protein